MKWIITPLILSAILPSYANDALDNLSWQGSLFFNDRELSGMYNVLKDNPPDMSEEVEETLQDIPKPPNLSGLLDKTVKQVAALPKTVTKTRTISKQEEVTFPALTLSSIIYYSPSNWSLWLNNKRYTYNDELPFKVIAVSANHVTFEMDALFLEHIPKKTQDKLIKQVGEWDYSTPNFSIRISQSSQKMQVTLAPHQFFNSYDLSIGEGNDANSKTITITKEFIETYEEPAAVTQPTNQTLQTKTPTQIPTTTTNIGVRDKSLKGRKASFDKVVDELLKE